MACAIRVYELHDLENGGAICYSSNGPHFLLNELNSLLWSDFLIYCCD